MDRLITTTILAAGVILAACTKASETEEVIGKDDLCVAIEDANISTKTTLSGEKDVAFESDDKILIYDTLGRKAVYKYRAKISGKVYFQKESGDDDFDIDIFESAFYPYEKVESYDHTNKTYTATFSENQTCTKNSFASGTAPMISFTRDSDGVVKFSNCFAVIRFGFKYKSTPETPLTLQSIRLTSSDSEHYLYGKFKFSSSGVTYVSWGEKSVELSGCETMGALGTTEKYYYITLPGLASGKTTDMTVEVTPKTDVPFSGKFTATTTSTNTLVANNILRMSPFVLRPIEDGVETTYELEAWDNSTGNIAVGQITLASSDVSVNVGESKDIQIFGATALGYLTTYKLDGVDYYDITTKEEDNKFYVTVTGKSAGVGQAFVNDQKTNSGSYLNITVN